MTAICSAGARGRKKAAAKGPTTKRERALVWRANYHPDGGQLFHPTKGQRRVAFVPGVPLTFKALRKKGYSEDPQTLGEHLKKRRCGLGLSQRNAAACMGIDYWTYLNWENGRTTPIVAHTKPALMFLGYDPFPKPTTLAERMDTKRRALGVTLEQVAKYLGWDPDSVACYLSGRWRLPNDRAAALERFLNLDCRTADLARVIPKRPRRGTA